MARKGRYNRNGIIKPQRKTDIGIANVQETFIIHEGGGINSGSFSLVDTTRASLPYFSQLRSQIVNISKFLKKNLTIEIHEKHFKILEVQVFFSMKRCNIAYIGGKGHLSHFTQFLFSSCPCTFPDISILPYHLQTSSYARKKQLPRSQSFSATKNEYVARHQMPERVDSKREGQVKRRSKGLDKDNLDERGK